MWKCRDCGYRVVSGEVYVTTGYCPSCNEHGKLIRYDPAENTPELPTIKKPEVSPGEKNGNK